MATERVIQFSIPGEPMGAPRMTRRDKWAKRPVVMRYFAWKDLARLHAGRLPKPEQIESLSWVAYFPPKKSWPKKRRVSCMGTLHRVKPDRDNIDKAILDALFKEDSGIAKGSMEKVYDINPRLDVTIITTKASGQ